VSPQPAQASIVITCFTQRRWPRLEASVESARTQSTPAEQVIVVVDHNDELREQVARRWPDVTVVANRHERGASGARNSGAELVTAPVLAFLDDDATAAADWLGHLVRCFDDPTVVGAGGGVTADWPQRAPGWFPEEFGWVVGASYRGLPERVAQVRNVWAENMAVRTGAFHAAGGFRLGFGKVGARSSPEDTDLCIRMSAGGGRWLYVPEAVVAHHVPAERATFGFFVRRCLNEGAGKADLAGLNSDEALGDERDYVRVLVPRAIRRDLAEALRTRRGRPAARAGAMLTGVAAAGVGYLGARAGAAMTRVRPAPALAASEE
jgi:GT2 family glycosyltransferase